MKEINWAPVLNKAKREYNVQYLNQCETENNEHPLTFDNYACMYYGIPRNVAQQFDAESTI